MSKSNNVRVVNDLQALTPVGAEVNVTVSNTAVALVTAAQIPAGCSVVRITNGANEIMVTFDGTDPAAGTAGAVTQAKAVLLVSAAAIAKARGIRQSADSVVNISFWAA